MKIRAAFVICVIFAVVMVVGAKGAALPKTAELVGADTVLLVDISDFNQFRTKLEKTRFINYTMTRRCRRLRKTLPRRFVKK